MLGRVRMREVGTKFWLFTFVLWALFALGYRYYARASLELRKRELVGRHQALQQSAGPATLALGRQLPEWLRSLAAVPSGSFDDHIASGWSLGALRRGRGLYARLALGKAEGWPRAESLAASRHDGFSSCLFTPDARPAPGSACTLNSHCSSGLYCNEGGRCVQPSRPYNVYHLLEPLRVFDVRWLGGLSQLHNRYGVRALELQLESIEREGLPIASAIAQQAEFFTAVLDEAPQGGTPSDGSQAETPLQRLQSEPHFARIGVWSLQDSRLLLRLRRKSGDAQLRHVGLGSTKPLGVGIVRARTRQASSCALASEVELFARAGLAEPRVVP